MTHLIPSSRIAAVALLFAVFATGALVFTTLSRAIGSPDPMIPNSTLGGGETDGTLDLPFNAGNLTNGQVLAAVLQPDGKVLVSGEFSKVHGVTRLGIARLNADGTLDQSFDPGTTALDADSITLQPDGKIIIITNLSSTINLARLNGNGSRDTSFNPSRGISLDGMDDGSGAATNPGTVYSVVLQPDGKVVVVGQFFFVITAPGVSVPRSCIARFNSDGSFDPSYNPGTGFESDNPSPLAAHAVRQSLGANSGKIVIQGSFDRFDGHPVSGLVRINPDASYDSTFTTSFGTDPSSISGLFAQSNDQIVVFGTFTSFRGVACSSIVRLNSSGVVDSGFNTAAFQDYGDVAEIAAVAQQPNGKLIVAGYFHSLGSATANNVARLETTGVRDASFGGTGADASASNVSAVFVRTSDGKIFVAGYFSSYGGAPRNNMAWANGDGSVDSTFTGLLGATDYVPQVYSLGTQADGKILVGGFFSSLNGASHYNLIRLNADSTIDPSFHATLGRYSRRMRSSERSSGPMGMFDLSVIAYRDDEPVGVLWVTPDASAGAELAPGRELRPEEHVNFLGIGVLEQARGQGREPGHGGVLLPRARAGRRHPPELHVGARRQLAIAPHRGEARRPRLRQLHGLPPQLLPPLTPPRRRPRATR